MLSYRHIFHAGNYADILKHTTLSLLLESLCKKEKPFTVIDTHAGGGLYDLNDERSQKTGEANTGILSLLKSLENPTGSAGNVSELPQTEDTKAAQADQVEPLTSYINVVRYYITDNQYPGSPVISINLMRQDDRLVLCELHNTEIEVLKGNISFQLNNIARKNSHVEIYHRNGFEMLNALVPPPMRRGLVLIDPSYETDGDWTQTGNAVIAAHKKWQTGIFAVWYPLLEHRKIEISTLKNCFRVASRDLPANNKNSLSSVEESHILFAELCTENTTEKGRLYGSGMCIINPPWLLEEKLKSVLPFLAKSSGKDASFSIENF